MSYGTEHDDDRADAPSADGDGIPTFAAQPPAWDDPARDQPAMPWSTPLPDQPDSDTYGAAESGSPLYEHEVVERETFEPGSYPPAQSYDEPAYGQAYQQGDYEQPAPYEPAQYEQSAAYEQPAPYEPAQYDQGSYDQGSYDQGSYDQGSYDQGSYDQGSYDQGAYEQSGAPQEPPPSWAQPVRPPDGGQYPAPGGYQAPGPNSYPVAAPPVPAPRPEDLLVPDQSPITSEPASWGWRGKLNRGSGGLFKAKASPAELEVREAIAGIQRGFSRPMTVVVVQPKGGAGKTPTTICLSAAFGVHRGGYVVGWDDNETRGTLAVRVQNPDSKRATVWDLLSDLDKFETNDARVGDLSQYVRAQSSHFDALVSDDNPGNMAQIGEQEFNRLHQVLQRFYRLIVVDTGNNVRSSNWQSAVSTADLVVVVSSYQRDVGYSGSWVLDHLAQTGREELARGAITVLTAADPTTDKTVREQLLNHFNARTRAVAEIPYDQALAHGGPIVWSELAPDTRNAWTKAGATIVDALVELDRQSLAARHR